ncbi:hypothetical protein DV092_08675 [Clostridium botulinum]|uniref:hypothetical protein n=1 Tax=Clostridium sp. ZBS20 TaxID=2949966 RepID=UPI0020794963|nr:hypothetical protein [Clostridium sp. ZBS20]MBN1052117.1 hypothetical protein [Clostridium botulinum]
MGEEEKWPLYDGYCNIYNGEINYCKLKDKKEKIIKFELSSITSMEKELKDDWVLVRFNDGGKVIKKEFKFKNTGDGEKFINVVLNSSAVDKFNDRTEEISFYNAIRTPLNIFLYTVAIILLFIGGAYGIVYAAQIMGMSTVRIPVVLLIPMKIVEALGINKCFMIIGVISLFCFVGALKRVVKRPKARVVRTI